MTNDEAVALQRKLAAWIRETFVDPALQMRLAELFIAHPTALVPWPLALAVAVRDPRLRDALAQVMQAEMSPVN